MEKHGMHPDPQSLEASFEPSGGRPDGSSGSPGRDPVVEDFNAFFEKLSSLDSLQWPAETPTKAKPAAAPQARPAGGSTGAVPAKAARPHMTVVKSDTDLGDAPAGPGAEAVAEPRGRATARDVARFLKMTLVGLLLFGLGLGAGWAALSIPGHLDTGMPSFAQLMERTRAITQPRMDKAAANQAATAQGTAAPAAPSGDPLRVVEAGRSGTTAGGTKPAGPAMAAGPAPRAPQPAAASQAVRPTPATQTAATTAAPSGIGSDEPADAAAAGGDIQLPLLGGTEPGHAATPAAQAAAGTPQFTLQVGACTSFACVENYRRMLLAKVGSRSIKVVTQPRGAGAASIQRVRIEPLERAEAERLKAELAALDARFKDAYLIALH
jgi:hypothetical protein